MTDAECVAFLRWALPRLERRWAGYRKVRRQVCKRTARRLTALGLEGVAAYRQHLHRHPSEWEELERLLPITLSRFYRDTDVFGFLTETLLPAQARAVATRGDRTLRVWSAGCASGEEPYSVALAWHCRASAGSRGIALRILATDIDRAVLERARAACYRASSLKLLPRDWRARAFEERDSLLCLKARYRAGVEFRQEDIRRHIPRELFDIILCRNLVFTYFSDTVQHTVLTQLREQLHEGGTLVIGRRERLPVAVTDLVPWPGAGKLRVYLPAGGRRAGSPPLTGARSA
jgi:chemotaxis protein methyltransferase CheR